MFSKKCITLVLAAALGISHIGPLPNVLAQGYTPGNYEGQAEGFGGNVAVEVTLTEDRIVSIDVDAPNETAGIGDTAIESITNDVIEKQSLNIDVVSGATGSSEGILAAIAAALESSGADVDALKAKEDDAEELEDEELDTDVVVIGAGGAGLAAAVSAVENGASVVILEKMPMVGGSTIIAGGQYNAVDQNRQQAYEMDPALIEEIKALTNEEAVNETHERLMGEVAEQIEEYESSNSKHLFDSPQLHALQTFKGGDYEGNIELIETYALGAEETVPWLESLGVEFEDEIAIVTGALWQRTHQFVKPLVTGPLDAYQAYLEEAGDDAQILLNTSAKELIIEDGKVVGVIAEQDGRKITVNADATILATGGFARNNEMVVEFDEIWNDLEGLGSTNAVSATGDGINMAVEAGANLVGMEFIQLLPVGDPETGGMQGNISKNAANQIFVNNEGKRFVAEDARRDTLTAGLLEQEDQEMWIIHDAHEYPDLEVKNDFNESIGQLVDNGKVVTGDTIEELAEAMGVDPNNLVETVNDYNTVVAGEKADDFGKTLLQDPLDQGPFYASLRVPTIHHTMGGVEITTQAEVKDEAGEIIPGLYACGEVTGGIHGKNRLGGNAIPDTVVFGRISGQNAAAFAKQN
ncbi:flavocytochrome c [Suicoccus acidiformans]|uniref:Urocanate reductase n=1 Tax=Suicoccus acidiformans TaxID=2036206 RepID=A0A347WKW3_9LACT|nr:flavocytochrome c [Suicoccus acidiformans]AXY25720.1 flavocytochrome c [Suicoccus acidiformans]